MVPNRLVVYAAFFATTTFLFGQTNPPDEYLAVNPRPVSKIPFEVTPARMERGRYLTVSFCLPARMERFHFLTYGLI